MELTYHSVISQLKALKYRSWVWPRKKKNYKNILFLCCKPVTCPTLYQTSCLIRVENIEIELKIPNLKTKTTKSASCLARFVKLHKCKKYTNYQFL